MIKRKRMVNLQGKGGQIVDAVLITAEEEDQSMISRHGYSWKYVRTSLYLNAGVVRNDAGAFKPAIKRKKFLGIF